MGAFPRSCLRNGLLAATALGLAMSADLSASAEVIISGTPDAVRIEASNATIEEVLSGLGNRFGLAYQSAARLDRKIDGTYAGQLPGVVKQLLAAYDFVLKYDNEAVSLLVTAESGSTRVTAQSRSTLATAQSRSTAQPSLQLESVSPNTGLPGQSQTVPGQAVRPPGDVYGSAVTPHLQTQLDSLLSLRTPGGTPGVTTPPPALAPSAPSPADVAQLTQRATEMLQSLRLALAAHAPR